MNYFLKIKSGVYRPGEVGTVYNAVLDGIETEDMLYSPWVKVDKAIWDQYNRMFECGDYRAIPGAFIDLVDSPGFNGLHVSVVPEGDEIDLTF